MNTKPWMQTAVVLLVAGACSLGTPTVRAGDGAEVILDTHWEIVIRPGHVPSDELPQIVQGGNLNVRPVGYQEEAPAPESTRKARREIGPELPAIPVAAPAPAPAPEMVPLVPRMSYAQAYAAIPFSRTEYEANPAYRQLAAMELMFGAMRPMTLVQQYTPKASRYPDFYQVPYGRSDTQHINIRQIGRQYGNSAFDFPFGIRSW